jgi:DNA-binding NarL/FixJ family response regulator
MPMKTTGDSIKIFVVDDNEMLRRALQKDITEAFPDKNLEVSLFLTGETCLDEIDRGKPEVVILDYHLNGKFFDAMNGLEALEKIKKKSPETAVLMMNKDRSVGLIANALNKGAESYIVKSLGAFNLFLKINAFLDFF